MCSVIFVLIFSDFLVGFLCTGMLQLRRCTVDREHKSKDYMKNVVSLLLPNSISFPWRLRVELQGKTGTENILQTDFVT